MRSLAHAFIALLVILTGITVAHGRSSSRRAPPSDYGKVVIGTYSEKANLAPVVFDHWVHRSIYTCRLCHVDVGFAMSANGTKIRSADNEKGYYCGTCHNGKMQHNGKAIFAACLSKLPPDGLKACERCHGPGNPAAREAAFSAFAHRLPSEQFGNGINWEKAEQTGAIKLIDTLDGFSARSKMSVQKDFAVTAKAEGLPDIIFSHKKHTVWNGCEVCHPDIFPSIKRGATPYSMSEIFEGKYCGVCHGKVAFPQMDCKRCHAKEV